MKLNTLIALITFTCCGLESTFSALGQNRSIRMTSASPIDTPVNLTVNSTVKEISVDWGDGHWVQYSLSEKDGSSTLSGKQKGEYLIVQGDDRWTMFDCSHCNITDIDLSQAKQLRSLYCQNNALASISVADLEHLVDFNCANNRLEKITFEKNDGQEKKSPVIENLNLSNNRLSGTYSWSFPTLQHLNISGNSFTAIEGYYPSLYSLWCSRNQLRGALNCKDFPRLRTLQCSENQLTELVASPDTSKISQLICDSNHISRLDLSHSKELMDISCSFNRLQLLKLPKSSSLTLFDVAENELKFDALPGKEHQPKFTYFAPQRPFHFKPEDGVLFDNGKAYLPTIVEWGAAGNSYLDLTPYTLLADSTADVQIHGFAIAADGNVTALKLRQTPDGDGDYYIQENRCGFFTPQPQMYVQLTSATYQASIQSTPIALLSNSTGIGNHHPDSQPLSFKISKECIIVHSPQLQTVSIFSLEGKKIYSQPLEGTISIPLSKGIYLLNSEKIVIP